MKIITRDSIARHVVEGWARGIWEGSFPTHFLNRVGMTQAVWTVFVAEMRAELDVNRVVNRILALFPDNEDFLRTKCDECDKYVDTTIQLGDEPDYESHTACLCFDCIKRASGLTNARIDGDSPEDVARVAADLFDDFGKEYEAKEIRRVVEGRGLGIGDELRLQSQEGKDQTWAIPISEASISVSSFDSAMVPAQGSPTVEGEVIQGSVACVTIRSYATDNGQVMGQMVIEGDSMESAFASHTEVTGEANEAPEIDAGGVSGVVGIDVT